MYHEARGEPFHGQVAVALVTLNRAKQENNICTEVYKKKQFSWTSSTKRKVNDAKSYFTASTAANAAYQTYLSYPNYYNFYHSKYINPPIWTKSKVATEVIGNHLFYW